MAKKTKRNVATGVKPGAWVRTSGGTVGKVLEIQGRPGAHRVRLDVPGMGPVWVHGRLYLTTAPNPRAPRRRRKNEWHDDSTRKRLPTMEEMARKLAENYKDFRRLGWTHADAQKEVLRTSTAGSGTRAIFKKIIQSNPAIKRHKKRKKSTPRRRRNIGGFLEGLTWAAGYKTADAAASALRTKKRKSKTRTQKKSRRRNPRGPVSAVQVQHGRRRVVFAGPAGMIRSMTQGLRKALGKGKVTTGKIVRR